MNPAWFFPFYVAMLTGTIAGLIGPSQPPEQRLPIIVAGCAYQGLSWIGSFLIIGIYFGRLMETGLPDPDLRPGMFVPVGAAGFTMVALISQARVLPMGYAYLEAHPVAAEILRSSCGLATLSCIAAIPKMGFTLSWWAFVFPNVGFTIATIEIGVELKSEGILWVSSAMTIVLVVIWLFTLVSLVKAVWIRQIIWPRRDGDKDMRDLGQQRILGGNL